MINLPQVTIVGIDCVDPSRLKLVMDLSQKHIEFGAAKILSSIKIDDPRWIGIKPIRTHGDHSEFCLRDLVNYIATDFALIIQWDGFILNPGSWSNVFLDYDYIGSPWLVKDWSINDFDFPESLRGKRVVGNGGFCIRSKKFLKLSSEFFNQGLILRSHPEDIAISVWYRSLFEKNGIKFAPSKIAQKFVFEGGDDKYSNQFGFHGFYTDLDQWFIENPTHDSIHRNYLEYKRGKRISWKPSK